MKKPVSRQIDVYVSALFLLLSICCLQPNTANCQTYPYRFDYLTADAGLSHTDANDVAQDKRGFIWIATYFGLDRYDGYTIRQYYNDNDPINNAFKNRIGCIYPDDDGNIWLGTEGGLQRFNTKTETYEDFNAFNKKGNPGIWRLFKPGGNLLYGLTSIGLKLYKVNDNNITEQPLVTPTDVHFKNITAGPNELIYLPSDKGLWTLDKKGQFNKVTIRGLPDQNVSSAYFDNRGYLLLGVGNRLCLLAKSAANDFVVLKQYTGPDNNGMNDIAENNKSDYWINNGRGLLRLDTNLNLVQEVTSKSSPQSLNSGSLTKIFIDRSQCLWVAVFGGGVNYCDLNEKLFYTLQHNPEVPNSLSGNHIRSILQEGDHLWIGTNASGLNLYNLKTQLFSFYNTTNAAVKLRNDAVTALVIDNDNNLWIGTNGGIDILRPDRKALLRPSGYDEFPTYVSETLAKDYYGNIWFGNHINKYGVVWKDKQGRYRVKYYDEGYFILADPTKPELFVSSTQGLKRIVIDAEGNITKTFRYNATNASNTLSSNYTYPVCKQNDSTFWIGTIGGGLNRLVVKPDDSYSIKAYTGKYGVFKDVETVEIDNAGNLWMGGNGLECLNPVSEKLVRYDKKDGLQGNSFKVGASYKGTDGRLYFGGINGLNYFYPDQIKTNSIAAQPVLTDILINNQKPLYTTVDSVENALPEAIGFAKKLQLNYLQNNFQIFFSAMHFANPLKCRYRYKLEGFDKDWRYTDGKNPSAAYSNLDYDRYTFIVEATNNDGVWSSTHAETLITITPPWWKTTLAKIIYALLILSALSGIYIYQARWHRLKREIGVREVNEKKKEEMHRQREELYQQQLMFFTNISHEFRTPLTLILGPLENLISQNKNAVLNNSYQLMLRNAKRLVNLISELMNFKKVSDSIIKLHVQPIVINQFCKNMSEEFENLAAGKDIRFKMNDNTGSSADAPLTGFFDIQVLEKILFNLLSNAFKYTDIGGSISFDIFFDIDKFKPAFEQGFQLLNDKHPAGKYIYFRIADTGIGISGDSITRIFDRYYRVTNDHLGSGVGLALVKSLTQLHKGDIYVYSERLQGTEIIIGIPCGEDDYNQSEKIIAEKDPQSQLELIDHSTLLPLADEDVNADEAIDPDHPRIRKHILIVDDNEELRVFLKQVFERHYYTYEAADGREAMEIATEKVPDLIISDVMMPGINGIELCKMVKEKFETSHIPFIILSAKDALDTKLEGMGYGADYYFAKPLSVDLLLLTVNNIFEQSQKLKERYTNNYLSEATELVQTEKDKEFLQQLLQLIEDHIQNTELDVDFLCKHLGISRTKLYQKIKSISDQSVSEFIRTIRLKRAIHIMTHEDVSMNEVVDRIGLQSSSNFSRAFKKEYGKSPMQFMQSLKKN